MTVNGAPVAGFVGSYTYGVATADTQFRDKSTGLAPTSWSWDFGDGGTSTLQNPTHQYSYAAPGTFNVSLTATNAYGNTTCTKNAFVTLVPIRAIFTGTPTSGPIPLTVAFTDASRGAPTSWSWSFGDNNSSTAQNPTHQYTAVGNFTVSLTVTNANGQDTCTMNNYITVNPFKADFSGSPTWGLPPLTVNFTDASSAATAWSWDFGDGGTSTVQNPSHAYSNVGYYTVSLHSSNAYGQDTCTKSNYITVCSGSVYVYPATSLDTSWPINGNQHIVPGSLTNLQSSGRELHGLCLRHQRGR